MSDRDEALDAAIRAAITEETGGGLPTTCLLAWTAVPADDGDSTIHSVEWSGQIATALGLAHLAAAQITESVREDE